MTLWFWIVTFGFALVAFVMILVILVQRPQGGGLAGAFGGAGGAGTDTVFGGRVGDALTVATVTAFAIYLALAITLNLLDPTSQPAAPAAVTPVTTPVVPETGDFGATPPPGVPADAVPFTPGEGGSIRIGDTEIIPPPDPAPDGGDDSSADTGGGGQ